MKPIKLTMQAFGPYRGREVVDFRDAVGAGLFGIYGPTGAGKSSIFSAMTFALFGEAAKSEQAINTLRSDHASPQILTEVEFSFELAGKTYLVRRRPDQLRPKARGEGETEEKHCAWLFDVTDLDIDDIGGDQSGRVLAERKVSDVAREVEQLLGYGPEQFRQIVLLPQGRFEAFLSANSSQRLEILRELFDVSLYQRLTEKFVAEARDSERQVQEGRALCTARLHQEGFESAGALSLGIETAQETARSLEQKATEAAAEFTAANGTLIQAQAIETRFIECERAERSVAELEAKTDEISSLRHRIELIGFAEGLADLDRELTEAREKLELALQKEAHAKNGLATTKAEEQSAKDALETENARSAEIELVRRDLEAVDRYEETLRQAEALESTAKTKSEALSAAETELRQAQQALTELETEHELLTAQLTSGTEAEARRAQASAELQQTNVRLKAAQDYERARSRASAAEASVTTAQDKALKARATADRAERAYQLAMEFLGRAQAQRLAEGLVEGQPCPVCGAVEHPKPAVGDTSSDGLEAAFEKSKLELTAARTADQTAQSDLASSTATRDERASALTALAAPEEPPSELSRKVAALEEELEELGPELDLQGCRRRLEDLGPKLKAAHSSVELVRTAEQTARTEAALAIQALASALKGVPENLRAKGALEAERDRLSGELTERTSAIDAVREREATARSAVAGAETELRNAEERVKEGQATSDKVSAEFEHRLSAKNLTSSDYGELKNEIPNRETLVSDVSEHEATLGEARGRALQSLEAIKGVERPDLEALQDTAIQKEMQAEQTRQTAATATARVHTLEALADALHQEFARLEELESQTGPMRALAGAFKGDNPVRTPLETYAIGAMFDHVLSAANLRLAPMTSGRYRLERHVEAGGGRGKRGLDIRVHDVHTGRAREICTLSGGETFIAALSLALGLSDVVEMSHGRIRLDTIFIDEGFGSLDADNDSGTLDQVLQVLQDIVGKNRAVGLISHVPLVQQAIPNGFTIKRVCVAAP